jgi:hypothetical protein
VLLMQPWKGTTSSRAVRSLLIDRALAPEVVLHALSNIFNYLSSRKLFNDERPAAAILLLIP